MTCMNIQPEGTLLPEHDTCPTIFLSDDQCEALGITEAPPPGKTYTLKVVAVATSVTSSLEEKGEEGESKPDVNLQLKLTDIEITDSGRSIADTLYTE